MNAINRAGEKSTPIEPSAAIIVVTFNSKRYFPRLRAALEAQTRQGFELIVWDNASQVGDRPISLDFPAKARIVQSETNLGFAAGNNRAAEMTAADFIVLLNPDAFPEPNWLDALITEASAHPTAGSIGSTQIMAELPGFYDGLGDCYHAFGVPWRGGYGEPVGAARVGKVMSACAAAALYRRDAWVEAGGFDETYFAYCEDVDLGFRLTLLGRPARQASGAIVYHIGGASSGKRSEFAIYHGTRNRLWTFVKCMPLPLMPFLLPGHLAITAAFLTISPFRGTGSATWRGVRDGLMNIGGVFRARSRVQRARKIRSFDLFSALSWNPILLLRKPPRDSAKENVRVSQSIPKSKSRS